jgi:putative glutathione S-transferase
MGLLVEGVWRDRGRDTRKSGGRFERAASAFRSWVTADGRPGSSGAGGFRAEAGRYHLYVSLACPWAHRALIFRALKRLEGAISLGVVEPVMRENGWEFAPGADPVNGARFLHQVYVKADPRHSGRVTVPVLWDKKTGTIVNNESAEIIRMFNGAFDALPGVDAALDFYPEALRAEIDAINQVVYARVNNGVYRAGFAATQEAYDEAVEALFETLDALEARLGRQRYLAGERLTEADWRLFTTLARFDSVYVGHFKCDRKRLVDYPNLWAYARELYQVPGVARTVDLDQIRRHYYASQRALNPSGIVPTGPALDFARPHGRDALAR